MKKNSITIVSIFATEHQATKWSIEKCIKNTPNVEDVVAFSDKDILGFGRHVQLKTPFTFKDFSDYVLKNIGPHVHTEYALFVQYDGIATNPELWQDEFFNYDYIGAIAGTPLLNIRFVGNGGLCLRSKRLLDALYEDPLIKPLDNYPEDMMISYAYANYLTKKYGIKYAPEVLAHQFSIEWQYYNPAFGFHGVHNVPHFLKGDEYHEWLSLVSDEKRNAVLTIEGYIKNLTKQEAFDASFELYDKGYGAR